MTEHRGETDFDRLVAELQQQIVEQERALYSAKVIEEAHHPKNLGRMARPDAYGIVHGWCGDTMEVYLRLNGARIREAGEIKAEDLVAALDGLPEESLHCAELAVNTLHEAIAKRSTEDNV
jgi:nitrogen fixation NifU-like protein